jgi:hypothetical protein
MVPFRRSFQRWTPDSTWPRWLKWIRPQVDISPVAGSPHPSEYDGMSVRQREAQARARAERLGLRVKRHAGRWYSLAEPNDEVVGVVRLPMTLPQLELELTRWEHQHLDGRDEMRP